MPSRRIVVEPMKRVEGPEALIERAEAPIIAELDHLVQSYKDKFHADGGEVKGSDPQIARAVDLSFEDRARRLDEDREDSTSNLSIFSQLVRSGEVVSPWWSWQREEDLRAFWKRSDHVSGAVYAMESKISNLNFRVLPMDPSVSSQVRMAGFFQRTLLETPEYGKGWRHFISRWVQDLLTSDNGAFAQIIGPGSPNGPIVGAPVSLANLDSARCTRTRNPIYPVIYNDIDGKRYRLHYTRVMFSSQMPSTRLEMHGVGFCAVSRCINYGQTLIDMATYSQEKLGSRPPRMLLVGKKGISARELFRAFATTREQDDSANLSRYRRMVAVAPDKGRGEIDLELIDLASIPDGFNQETSTTLGMFTIALAFGMDAREIWPATTSGATKADAMVQHLKARGKGPGQIMQEIELQLNQKFLPDQLLFRFDFQDDEQDAMQAEIRDKRSQRHERDTEGGVITIRVAREQMLADGDISPSQFEQMELQDGRLPSGDPIVSLFFTADQDIKKLFTGINVESALTFAVNADDDVRRERMLKSIDAAIIKAQKALAEESWSTQKQKARQALAALEFLREKWEEGGVEMEEEEEGEESVGGRPRENTRADTERRRNEDNYRGDAEITTVRGAIGKK